MGIYRRILVVLQSVLERCAVKHWSDYVKTDIVRWDNLNSVEHHLAAYHKDGLNDCWICETNGHQVNSMTEAWANEIRDILCFMAIDCARYYQQGNDLDDLDLEQIPHDRPISHQLLARKCSDCGSYEFSKNNIERCVARLLAKELIKKRFKDNQEITLSNLDEIYASNNAGKQREAFISEITKLHHYVTDDGDFRRPCQKCGSQNSRVSYWSYKEINGRLNIEALP